MLTERYGTSQVQVFHSYQAQDEESDFEEFIDH